MKIDTLVAIDTHVHIEPDSRDTAADEAARNYFGETGPSFSRQELADYYRAGVPVAFGTDSLASAPTLNLFDELAEARRIAPNVPASLLVDSATRRGAQALGMDGEYGTIEAGKRAALISVTIPPDLEAVEEYLVSGNVRAPQDVRLIRSR